MSKLCCDASRMLPVMLVANMCTAHLAYTTAESQHLAIAHVRLVLAMLHSLSEAGNQETDDNVNVLAIPVIQLPAHSSVPALLQAGVKLW